MTNENEISFVSEEENAPQQIKKIRNDLKQCAEEKKEYLDGWQRAKADFINYKKEEGMRMEDMARFITIGMVRDILPALDSFDLALRNNQQNNERGILLVLLQLLDILKKQGLEEIETKAGGSFNPEIHESIGEVESEAAHGTIAEEVQKGYRMQGRVIRPARVRLAK